MDTAHPSVLSTSPPRTRTEVPPPAASTSTGDDSTGAPTQDPNPVPEPVSNNINPSIKLNTHDIPPQFFTGGGGGGGSGSAGAGSSPTASPRGAFASNYSLKSELENIRLEDHCFVRRQTTQSDDPEEYPDPDNINMGSLLARMRQIRSSGQIQYRIPKKRRREDEPKTHKEGEESEIEMETITVQRQKRVKKNPKGPRSEKDKGRGRKEKRDWFQRPPNHPPMMLETAPEVKMEVAPEHHPPMVLDNVRSGGEAEGEGVKFVAD